MLAKDPHTMCQALDQWLKPQQNHYIVQKMAMVIIAQRYVPMLRVGPFWRPQLRASSFNAIVLIMQLFAVSISIETQTVRRDTSRMKETERNEKKKRNIIGKY